MSNQEINVFEQASRQRLRFKGANGMLSTEDLWSLSLPRLDEIAKVIRKELRDSEESFIEEKKTNATAELMFAVVKRVIDVRLEEREAKAKAKENSERRQKLLAALENKQNAVLDGMSVEEIQKELTALS